MADRARYVEATSHESLGEWRAGREAQARKDAREGVTRPDIMSSPSIQRMARQLGAHEERKRELREGLRASADRQLRKQPGA